MNKKKWILVAVCLVVAAAALLTWRLWPRSLASVVDPDEAKVQASFSVVETGVKDGETYAHGYDLNNVKPGDAHYDAVMAILGKTTYRPSMKNLLPLVKTGSTVASGNQQVFVALFVWGKEGDSEVLMLRSAGDRVWLENDTGIYYPADSTVLAELTDYVKAHGISSK